MRIDKPIFFNFKGVSRYYPAQNTVSVQERLEQLKRTAECKDFAEHLKARSKNKWDTAGWYLSVLEQVLKDGENCEYLKQRETGQQKITAIDQLEKEIEWFLR